MALANKKTRFCTVVLKALERKTFADQISWVMKALDRHNLSLISFGSHFISEADLPFQAHIGLDATQEEALMLTWFFADITLNPKNRAETHTTPLTGEKAQRNVAVEVIYQIDF